MTLLRRPASDGGHAVTTSRIAASCPVTPNPASLPAAATDAMILA